MITNSFLTSDVLVHWYEYTFSKEFVTLFFTSMPREADPELLSVLIWCRDLSKIGVMIVYARKLLSA